MLVLSRKKHEVIQVGNVLIQVSEINGDKVRLGIVAPEEVPITRSELLSEDRQAEIIATLTPKRKRQTA